MEIMSNRKELADGLGGEASWKGHGDPGVILYRRIARDLHYRRFDTRGMKNDRGRKKISDDGRTSYRSNCCMRGCRVCCGLSRHHLNLFSLIFAIHLFSKFGTGLNPYL
jgi:hypothetical protein